MMTREIYPKIEVYENRLWLQATRKGKWIKIPKKRALYLADRLTRAAKRINIA